MTNAWDLHNRWPESSLEIVPDAGHAAFEPGIVDRLIEATDRFGLVPSGTR
jgi:proline iminopeptidase